MHEVEEVIGLHAVLGHQSAHRGAVAFVIVLLQPERVLLADLEVIRDVVADALVDLLPEIDVMRVEGVVEVEHPGVDLIDGTRARAGREVHGGWRFTDVRASPSRGKGRAKGPRKRPPPMLVKSWLELSTVK